jgi:glycosyltransferase involved in cell wall biosynthesis
MSSRKPTVCFSVTNCICFDQRVLKIASVVSSLDCEILIIGRRLGDCCSSVQIPFRVKRFRMVFKKGFLFYMFYQVRLFFYLLTRKTAVLVANDLDTLLPNYLVSVIRNVPLIFDSHEYFTGVPELRERHLVRSIWKFVERRIVPRLKYVMTVSGGIARLYNGEYGISPLVVMNCSPSPDHIVPYSREELGIRNGDLLVILQGTGINIGRGGDELIEAIALTSDVSLIVAGSGSAVVGMKILAAAKGIEHRVKFTGQIAWEHLIKYTKAADIGASLDDRTDLNHLYSLPNKLFDYISSGIAVLASDLPEINSIVQTFSCGITLKEVTTENIASALAGLARDRTMLYEMKRNALYASEKLNWNTESSSVSSFYSKILQENGYF